jgi:hypothetical protein
LQAPVAVLEQALEQVPEWGQAVSPQSAQEAAKQPVSSHNRKKQRQQQ